MTEQVPVEAIRGCRIEGCNRPFYSKLLCCLHYGRLRSTGRTDLESREERFWKRVEKTDGCWLWTGTKTSEGYGCFRWKNTSSQAHRVSYEFVAGEVPRGKQVDHICHVKSCVNPSHLRAVSNMGNQENHNGARSNSKSGVRGVYRNRWGSWVGAVRHDGKRYYAGSFSSIVEAERVVIALRNKLHTYNDKDRVNL